MTSTEQRGAASGHYAGFKQADPDLVPPLIRRFPFAMIAVNGVQAPVIARAPLTPRCGRSPAGAVEFHLARTNPIVPLLEIGSQPTVVVSGPSAPISPS